MLLCVPLADSAALLVPNMTRRRGWWRPRQRARRRSRQEYVLQQARDVIDGPRRTVVQAVDGDREAGLRRCGARVAVGAFVEHGHVHKVKRTVAALGDGACHAIKVRKGRPVEDEICRVFDVTSEWHLRPKQAQNRPFGRELFTPGTTAHPHLLHQTSQNRPENI